MIPSGAVLASPPLTPETLPPSALLVSIALAVASAVAYALAAVLQQRLAAGAPGGPGPTPVRQLATRPGWWISVAFNGAGAALHVAALAYGPLSVVQPLGVLTLVFALPIGAAMAGRRVGARHWRGAAATVIGLGVLLLLVAPASTGKTLEPARAWVVVAAAGALIVGLGALAAAAANTGVTPARRQPTDRPRPAGTGLGGGTGGRPVVGGVLFATAAGVAFAVASALTQTIMDQVGRSGLSALVSPLTLALAVMATAGLLLTQLAYRGAGLGAPLAVATLANPVASAVIGMTMLNEGTLGGATGAVLALAAAGIAAWGVVQLSTSDRPVAGRPLRRRPDPAPSTR